MIRNTNTVPDLRRKTDFGTYLKYNNLRLNLNDCMVILVVLAVLLFTIMAVSATPNPMVIGV